MKQFEIRVFEIRCYPRTYVVEVEDDEGLQEAKEKAAIGETLSESGDDGFDVQDRILAS